MGSNPSGGTSHNDEPPESPAFKDVQHSTKKCTLNGYRHTQMQCPQRGINAEERRKRRSSEENSLELYIQTGCRTNRTRDNALLRHFCVAVEQDLQTLTVCLAWFFRAERHINNLIQILVRLAQGGGHEYRIV